MNKTYVRFWVIAALLVIALPFVGLWWSSVPQDHDASAIMSFLTGIPMGIGIAVCLVLGWDAWEHRR